MTLADTVERIKRAEEEGLKKVSASEIESKNILENARLNSEEYRTKMISEKKASLEEEHKKLIISVDAEVKEIIENSEKEIDVIKKSSKGKKEKAVKEALELIMMED